MNIYSINSSLPVRTSTMGSSTQVHKSIPAQSLVTFGAKEKSGGSEGGGGGNYGGNAATKAVLTAGGLVSAIPAVRAAELGVVLDALVAMGPYGLGVAIGIGLIKKLKNGGGNGNGSSGGKSS